MLPEGHARIGHFAGSRNLLICHAIVCDAPGGERGTSRGDLVAGGEQQIDPALGPSLPQLLEDLGRFAQVVEVTWAVLAREFLIRLPAVGDQGTANTISSPKASNAFLPRLGYAPCHVSSGRIQWDLPAMCMPVSSGCATEARMMTSPIAATVGTSSTCPLGLNCQHRGVRHRQAAQIPP